MPLLCSAFADGVYACFWLDLRSRRRHELATTNGSRHMLLLCSAFAHVLDPCIWLDPGSLRRSPAGAA